MEECKSPGHNYFSYIEAQSGLSLSALWDHCMATGMFAKDDSTGKRPSTGEVSDTFMAGLLHDVGKLVLAVSLPERYREVLAWSTRRKVVL